MSINSGHALNSIGSSPIPGGNPWGENIRYETEFEQLEAELAKQESLTAETVDWQVVARLASGIIQNSSKDLLVGSYLCYALLLNEGFKGLAVGLHVLGEMVDHYWDGLFPPIKRMRARQTAFKWLAEKTGQYLTENTPSANDNEAIVAAYDALKALDNLLVEKMGDQAPMLTEMTRPLKNFSQSARAELEKAGVSSESVAEAPVSEPAAAVVPEAPAVSIATESAPTPAAESANDDPRAAIAGHALSSIGSVPISEANPAGEDVRYESEFEQLEAELAKQESLSAETVDWQVVARLSTSIIQKSSRDLLVGSYLSYALLINEGYLGFAAGLNVVCDMVDLYWEDLYPPVKRLRARKAAFVWLSEKVGQYFTDHPPGPSDNEAVIAASDIIRALDNLLVEKMGDQAPMLTDMSRPLKNFSQSARAEVEKAAQAQAAPTPVASTPEPVPSAAPETTTAEVPVAEPAPAAKPAKEKAKPAISAPADAGAVESDADTRKILRQLQTTMRDIASFWISAKLSDPRPYRQGRVAAWMVVENLPPDNGGVTQINPPAPERLKYFETQVEKNEHATLVVELEKTLARSPFWLDGHFLVVQTLRKLGAEYDEAVQTIIRELRNFLDRLPGMLQLSFSDGTPFAGDQTRMWVESEVLASTGGASSASTDTGSGELWSAALDSAKQIAAGGDARQALATMNEGIANSRQIRDQFYWRCALAELLLHMGSADEAAAILEQAGTQAAQMQVATWEPGLLAKIYNLLYQSYQKQQKARKDDKSIESKAEEAFKKFCWFDPVTALSQRGK